VAKITEPLQFNVGVELGQLMFGSGYACIDKSTTQNSVQMATSVPCILYWLYGCILVCSAGERIFYCL